MKDGKETKTYTFEVPERFDANLPKDVSDMLQKLPEEDYDCVVLDMSVTITMGSAGIGLLVHLYKELTARGKALIIRKPQRGIYNLLMETGIDRLFDIEMSSGIVKADADLCNIDARLDISDELIDGTCVISLNGVMNYPAGAATFKKHMFLALAVSNKILIDMTDLAFFDSLSVGAVLRLNRLMRDNHGAVKICCANPVVRNVFENLGVDHLIPIYDTREEALADKDI